MIHSPQKRISKRALPVWRMMGMFHSLIVFLIWVGSVVMIFFTDLPKWIPIVLFVVLLLYVFFFVYLFPLLRWKRWRYDVREQEIELQHGIFIIKRTLIPMIRVQHVDTRQGPLLKKYHLASVTVSTAATEHEIPALDVNEAEELRYFISKLARVADEDV